MTGNDQGKFSRAQTAATLRAVVAGYFMYIGWKIATNTDTDMSPLTAKLIGGIFIAAALCFGVWVWKRWRTDREQEKLAAEQAEAESSESEGGE